MVAIEEDFIREGRKGYIEFLGMGWRGLSM